MLKRLVAARLLLMPAFMLGFCTSTALADGLPISGPYGSKWACDMYRTSGIAGIVNDTGEHSDVDQLILPDQVAEPGRLCSIQGKDGNWSAMCTQLQTWNGKDSVLRYTNSVVFEKISEREIFYGEVRAGFNYTRCR